MIPPDRRAHRRDVLVLLVLAGALLLPNLGVPRLWADEGDTAVLARTILARGLPYAWDGRTFTDSDRGLRLNAHLVMVSTPWLPYYVTAASFAALGESPFAARLPFALCGAASVVLLYELVRRVTGDRRAALAAALLCLASVQLLLYYRQSRYYALGTLLTLAGLLGFWRLRERPRDPTFAVSCVLLFHCHPLPAAALAAAAAGLAAVHPVFRTTRRALAAWLAGVLAFTAPWAWLGSGGWAASASMLSRELPARAGQLSVELAEAVPLPGWLLLAVLARRRLGAGDRAFLALALAALAALALGLLATLSPHNLWVLGLRYGVAAIPLAAGVTGVLAARASAGSSVRLAAWVALFAATHLPGAALLLAVAPSPPSARRAGGDVILHRPRGALGPWLRTEWAGYALELTRTSPGSVARIVEFLSAHAGPDDRLVTNYAWEPLYFHTHLPQALKILPDYPIAPTARAAGLPGYVFEARDARWVVWRIPWEGYQGYELARVRREIEAAGGRLVPAAALPETVWENRPELHFHRFPGLGHLYPDDMRRVGYGSGAPVAIFEVVRPDTGEGRPGSR